MDLGFWTDIGRGHVLLLEWVGLGNCIMGEKLKKREGREGKVMYEFWNGLVGDF